MVQIFYYRSPGKMPDKLFQQYLLQLPDSLQKKVHAFKQWQDAERSLAGYLLLKHGLEEMHINNYSLSDLKYGEFHKPYFDDKTHFNISHSGLYTICAISETNIVGIDVEQVNEIPLGDFTEFFYDEEWQNVLH